MRTYPLLLTFFCMLAAPTVHAQTTVTPDSLQPLYFLVGTWSGAGKSDSGAIQGTTTIQKELQGRVLVRRDTSTFPKAGTRNTPYEQMMVITPDPSGSSSFQADYWDSVGHVLVYVGTVIQVGGAPQAQFLSIPAANMPRFRLTYTATSPGRLHTVFEMEPPGGTAWHTIADGYSVKAGMRSKRTS